MSEKKSSFVKVDELLPQVTLERAAEYYGVQLPEMHGILGEVRMRCFLACGRTEETGDRAIALQVDNPVKPWKCHVYECQKGGNLVGLCDLMKAGQNAGGRPRGERFKQIAADLAAMVNGEQQPPATTAAPPRVVEKPAEKPPINVPLKESENERARELVNLDEQFVTDIAEMPPEVSAYLRRRQFLTPEVMKKYRVGYLRHSAKSLLRGHFVYAYQSSQGDVLGWFGRNIHHEQQLAAWQASDRSSPSPVKARFVKGFHRGLELWGEHVIRIDGLNESKATGLVVVEGPNDAIRLQLLAVPTVALCSNTITREQVERIAQLVDDCRLQYASLMLDCDEEGINGSRQALPLLAERVPVRLAWSNTTAGGKFKGRQPESLTAEEWIELHRV